jgi:hypothetical protein
MIADRRPIWLKVHVEGGAASPDWRLTVSGNGIGKPEGGSDKTIRG